MKKLTLSALLLIASASASATGLSVVGSAPIAVFTGYGGGGFDDPVPQTGPRTSGVTGVVTALSAGNIRATYLGQESGHLNQFSFIFDNLFEITPIGNSAFDSQATAGALSFKFIDTFTGTEYSNGSVNIAIMSGAIPSSISGTDYGPFDYILGFNDFFGDNDYDDFVVGLEFTPATVPVPAALPLLATALGLFGFSRRKSI